ncbi:c-type cytochrome biogenesis protein CcsB [Janibacter cremeus]|uniref:Cytochrome c-type biogenesis protein CcsB n=1 Tax=Janibacter cremeus TaxID=1285192 RepID=A0A852VVH2_9MICO|nr:c-type cytochrome biogenesis protein CcsB [Janibacter cremeus]NYF97775.1 cytochrome c-type biogenesis protein CcsB [Janibacter cremeus]
MNNEMLAQYANYALASAALVVTVAMLCYALYLAQAVPVREQVETDTKVPATVGGPSQGDTSEATGDGAAVETPMKARKAAGIAGSLSWLGAGLLLLSFALRGFAVGRFPLGNLFEFSTAGAFFALATFGVASLRRDLRWLGVFVTAFVTLLLMVASTAWYVEADEVVPSLQSYWLPIHVTVATLSVGVFTVGAIVSGLYLLSDRGVGGERFWRKLPPARSLEKFSYSLHIIGFPLWSFTLIAGAIWAREAWGSYWNWDPKEVWTFVIWTVYAAYLHARATKNTSRRSANWIAIAGFACIIINYTVVNFYFIGQHSYAQ